MSDEITDAELEKLFELICSNSLVEFRTFLNENSKFLKKIDIDNFHLTAHYSYYLRLLNNCDYNVKYCRTNKLTVLTIASAFGSKEIVELFIKEFEVDEDETGFFDFNCFTAAVLGNNIETMRYLYSINKNLCNAKADWLGETTLTRASAYSEAETVKILFAEFNADIYELGFRGRNLFLRATEGDKIDTMRYLHKIDENLCKGKDKEGDTALTLASKFGSKETVEVLIKEFNADIHELGLNGQNCFLRAATGGKIDTMRFLHKIDKNLCKGKDYDGRSMYVLSSKSYSIFNILQFDIWPEEIDFSLFLENYKELGEGGMSTVYKAQLGDSGTYFALKVIDRKHKLGMSGKDPVFKKEYSILKSLKHKNIVHVYSSSEVYKNNILVLELADGNLDDCIEKSVSAAQRRSWCIDVLSGLEYLHTRPDGNILHRDLKNTNILVFENNGLENSLLKITDFGCSEVETKTLNMNTRIPITPKWIAPEILNNLKHTKESDMYSLGLILYGILIKSQRPFDFLMFLKNTELENFIDDLKVFAGILRKCVDHDPAKRMTIEDCKTEFTSLSDQNKVPCAKISNFETKTLFLDHTIVDDRPIDLVDDLKTAMTVSTKFAKLHANISDQDDWIVKLFKKISQGKATWKILQKNSTECVYVYLNNDKLVLFNHANNGRFGGIGHTPLENESQVNTFANLLRKLVDDQKRQNTDISEIQIIGCDVSRGLAQCVANKSGIPVKTLKNFNSMYDENIYGHSRIAFNDTLELFVYGFVFDNPQEPPDRSLPFHWVNGINFDNSIPYSQVQQQQLFIHNMTDWRPVALRNKFRPRNPSS